MAVSYAAPEYYQYNLTLDRELARDLAVEVGYVGSLGRHLGRRYNLNQPIVTGLQTDGTLVSVRPFPAFADIQFQDQTIRSSYNAVQASARRRMSGGLTFLAAYTFSRMIDTGSVSTGNLTNVSTSGAQKSPQDIYDMRAERGLSDLHRSHQFSTAFSWALPVGSGRRFLAAALDHGCTEIAGRSRVSVVMRRLRGHLERQREGEKKLEALLHRLREPD
jgi:hypothetical protein